MKESTPLQVKTSAAKETQPPLTPSPSNRQSSRVAARQAAAAAAKASPRKTLETSRTIVQGEVFPGEKDGGRMGPPLLVPGPTTYQVEDSLYRRDSFPRPSSASTSHQKQSTSTDQTILRPKGGLELISSQGPDSTKTSTSSMGDHMYFSVPTKPSTAMQG